MLTLVVLSAVTDRLSLLGLRADPAVLTFADQRSGLGGIVLVRRLHNYIDKVNRSLVRIKRR